MKKIFLVLMAGFLTAGTAFAAEKNTTSASDSGPQQMLDFNLDGYGTNGRKTWDVQGAQMDMEGDDVKISDITAHLYGEKENMVLTADHGHFDRQTGTVYLKDNVRAVTDSGATLTTNSLNWAQKDQLITTDDLVNITRGDLTATAKGISARPDVKVAKFEKDVVLTLEEQKKAQGGKSPQEGGALTAGKMVITCDGPMELNYEKSTAIFEKNVKVEGDAEQGTMIADKMTVYFNQAAKQIDKMVAEGNVKIIRGENISYSEGAVFTAADKRLVLTGRPKLIMFSGGGKDVSPGGQRTGQKLP